MAWPTEDIEWAENAAADDVEEPALERGGGFIAGTPAEADKVNWLFRGIGRWIQAFRALFNADQELTLGSASGRGMTLGEDDSAAELHLALPTGILSAPRLLAFSTSADIVIAETSLVLGASGGPQAYVSYSASSDRVVFDKPATIPNIPVASYRATIESSGGGVVNYSGTRSRNILAGADDPTPAGRPALPDDETAGEFRIYLDETPAVFFPVVVAHVAAASGATYQVGAYYDAASKGIKINVDSSDGTPLNLGTTSATIQLNIIVL